MRPAPILITRPAERAAGLMERLAALGYAPHLQPLQTLSLPPLPSLDASGADGILITSRNALHALQRLPKDLPLYAVGEETGREAAGMGFGVVITRPTAEEMVEALKEARSRHLLYLSGNHVSRDIAAALKPYGTRVRREVAYHLDAVPALSAGTVALLARSPSMTALFFSGRPIRIFLDLLARHDLEDAPSRLAALVIHPRHLPECRGFRAAFAASEPTLEGMLALAREMQHSI